jgi:hypothetical protein
VIAETTKKPAGRLAGGLFSVGKDRLDQARLNERIQSTIFGDGFDRFAREAEFDVMTELRNPDALVLKVRRNLALHHLGDVTSDTTFFLGETRTMDASTAADVRTSDTANA